MTLHEFSLANFLACNVHSLQPKCMEILYATQVNKYDLLLNEKKCHIYKEILHIRRIHIEIKLGIKIYFTKVSNKSTPHRMSQLELGTHKS